jgi:hypothetical protein
VGHEAGGFADEVVVVFAVSDAKYRFLADVALFDVATFPCGKVFWKSVD